MLGKRLVFIRKFLNLSQKEMAEILGVSQATLSRYENNLFDVPSDSVKQLVETFDINPDWLYSDNNDEELWRETSFLKSHKNNNPEFIKDELAELKNEFYTIPIFSKIEPDKNNDLNKDFLISEIKLPSLFTIPYDFNDVFGYIPGEKEIEVFPEVKPFDIILCVKNIEISDKHNNSIFFASLGDQHYIRKLFLEPYNVLLVGRNKNETLKIPRADVAKKKAFLYLVSTIIRRTT